MIGRSAAAVWLGVMAFLVGYAEVPPARAAADPVRVDTALVPGGRFQSILPAPKGQAITTVAKFHMDRRPVTQGEFLAFVRAHPQWQRGRSPALFTDSHYLSSWQDALALGPQVSADQPVTGVSWFAARAYCEARGARLPTWLEWEYVAAADEAHADARATAAWQQQILNWYSRPSNQPLPPVGKGAPNLYGIYDLHGLVWEWVEDAGSLMMGTDNREAGNADVLKFCGTGALALENREAYAIAMRVAMLSSLQARDTTTSLGFRCAATP